jgi:four helix bundle protein
MGVRRYRDLFAWQLAEAFKREVFELIRQSPSASRDFRYKTQLLDAASAVSKDIVEGFLRYSAAEFARFLDYALGSLGEGESRLAEALSCGISNKPTVNKRFAMLGAVSSPSSG